MKFSSLAAVKVVKMTIFSAFSDENFIKLRTFPFSVSYQIMQLHHSIIILYNAIIDKIKRGLASMIPCTIIRVLHFIKSIHGAAGFELGSSLIRYKVKVRGQRSKVKVTEVMTPLTRSRTVTPVWIHIWWWNDAQSLMLLGRGALLFFRVIRQISRSHS